MIESQQIRKFVSCCCDMCGKKIKETVNDVTIICKQEHIICEQCFKRVKQTFTCQACQQTCNKKSSLRCKWRFPLMTFYNACKTEMEKISLIGPSLTEKISRLKAMQKRGDQLQERQGKIVQRLALTGDLIEPTPSQYQYRYKKFIEQTQRQAMACEQTWIKKVTANYKQQINRRYNQIISFTAKLQDEGRQLVQSLQNIKQTNKELIKDNIRYDHYFDTKGEQWRNYRQEYQFQ